MAFQFVENNHIDGAARKLIRSHVVKGKNVGKTRVGGKRNFDRSLDGVPSVPESIGNSFSFFTFPSTLQPYMRELIRQCNSFL